jgi:precorrin-6B methylase 2
MVQQVGHWRRMLTSRQYAELHRNFAPLQKMFPGVAGETSLFGKPVRFVDSAEFLAGYEQIFQQEVFKFCSASVCPKIIDWAAGIGMRVIYWKRLFAKARIVAFENNPARAAALAYNCGNLEDTTIEVCSWGEARTISDTESGHAGLKDFLKTPADVLHLRVTSGEVRLLEGCEQELKAVGYIAVEYLDHVANPQTLPRLFQVLQNAGFRIQVHTLIISQRPWYQRDTQEVDGVNDLGVYIFGFRASV